MCLPPTLAPAAAVHPGDRRRRKRPAERVDEQHARTGLRRRSALEGLDAVTQTVLIDGRIGQDHYGFLRGACPGPAPRKHSVGWIDGVTIITLRPPLKKHVSGDVPDDALGTIGEVDRVRERPDQGHGPVISADAACGLHEHVLDSGGWRVSHWTPFRYRGAGHKAAAFGVRFLLCRL